MIHASQLFREQGPVLTQFTNGITEAPIIEAIDPRWHHGEVNGGFQPRQIDMRLHGTEDTCSVWTLAGAAATRGRHGSRCGGRTGHSALCVCVRLSAFP